MREAELRGRERPNWEAVGGHGRLNWDAKLGGHGSLSEAMLPEAE